MLDKMVPEQRLTTRLSNYWERLRDGASLPNIERFRSGDIPDMWEFCFQVSVDQHDASRKQYLYGYMGRQIIQAFGQDLTGKRVNSMVQNVPGANILKKIDSCVDGRQILTEDGKFINDKSKVVKYRSCMLPFGNDAGVTHVVVGLSWRAF